MQWLAEICVRRPVFATVIILALTVVGYFGYTKFGVDRFPKVDFPDRHRHPPRRWRVARRDRDRRH